MESAPRPREVLKILAIDDSEVELELIKAILQEIENPSCVVYTTTDPHEAYSRARDEAIDLVLTDLVMPDDTGKDVVITMREINPRIDVVVITGHADVQEAVSLMKTGATDYLVKPVRFEDLQKLVRRAEEHRHVVRENALVQEAISESPGITPVVSRSQVMTEVLNLAARSAKSNAAVLIRGETGTGKELIARVIHSVSERRDRPFISVNIAALPESLIESELFGHRKGSFTGATADRVGRFEEADGGTLFIDEVGDIPADVQVKLLRVLQFGTFEPVGESKSLEADVRIISATNQDLENRILDGSFRVDFYYRLNVIEIFLPPLRKRREDIPLLVEYFIPKYAERNRSSVRGITHEALDRLMKYPFPGNIRELENIVERAVVLCRGEYITEQDISVPASKDETAILDPRDLEQGYEAKMNHFESELIREALNRSNGNKSEAARRLGISERRLRSRMDILGLK